MTEPVLVLDHVTKRFGPVTVIDDVTVPVRPGQVQVLLGENGAGKSTLIKMMSGIYQPDGGRILIDGREVSLPSTKAAESFGIATIHQELNLAPNLSVAENIMLGRTPSKMGLFDKRETFRRAREALDIIGLDVDLSTPVHRLGVAKQQLVEIAKALSQNARILILDEPTATLTKPEIAQLFAVMNDLRAKGVAMVFISHHLDEIAEIGDTVTVLRDGQFIEEVPAKTPENQLVQLMVGRSIDQQFPRQKSELGETLLEVKGLTREGVFEDVTFSVRAGEVVGIAGLVGAGRTEVVRSIAGADPYDAGTVTVRGKAIPRFNVAAGIAAGLGHVPEDRKVQGLVLDASVNENLGYATLKSTAKMGLADRRGQRRRATSVAEKLRVRMASVDQKIRNLSGGNQQKVVFGRWMLANSHVLLLDEPTRGVDVGAKVEIYQLINEVTARGGAVLMVSSELPEVLGMSDRILVMSRGRIAGELDAAQATQDAVMTLAVRNVTSAVHTHDVPTDGSATTNNEPQGKQAFHEGEL
ncbi:sugar ABC transporter ATP-binding protein [Arcanobacterium bovis]|uniref:Sugar ABC transporter ATP-binding protein n=1 Tax=Arcanobacterium bovis TaxID=2529275 RepID=A0A4Q9V248_9ACTO|nr:sugar ABC transporter ATP-binding protein [Arcanobacterium bovis]TBW22210.1 sugar ABC transporter ATP-binding protein [Arcanobacterium bovis]